MNKKPKLYSYSSFDVHVLTNENLTLVLKILLKEMRKKLKLIDLMEKLEKTQSK
jgi:hypothetical protein